MINRIKRRLISEIKRRWTTVLYAAGLPAAIDRLTARREAAAIGRSDHPAVSDPAGPHLLICPPGAGNIGDEALFEAFVEGVDGPVVVITRNPDEFAISPANSDRLEIRLMPDLIYGRGRAHLAAIAELRRMLTTARSLSIIGADLMDGKYSVRGSVRRSVIAEIGARAGVDTRIIGFSWNSSPLGCARRALSRAAKAGVVAYLRDPMSAMRARHDGITGVQDAADIVFSYAGQEAGPIEPPAPYAILNTSGLIDRTGDRTEEYLAVVQQFRAAGLHVVILPHVIKDLSDDLVAARRLYARIGAADVTLVDQLLPPRQIRRLASGASIVVTGRMHLAIMSLQNGVPAVTLATQGKVEGLMSLFGTPELCVEPTTGFGRTVVDVLARALPTDSATRTALTAALPTVIALSQRNIAGLAQVAREEVRS